MAITPVDKIKIIKFLKDNPIGEIYYLDLCDALGKREKIKDIEFLEFFVDLAINEFKKNEKISIKQVNKIVVTIESFLEWVHEAGNEIPEIILDKIRSLDEYYDQYLIRNDKDVDLELADGYLASLLKKVDELYPKEFMDESVIQYINKIEELKKEVSSIKREYDNLVKLYEELQNKANKKQTDFLQKRDENNRLANTNANNEKEINRLNELIRTLEEKIAVFEKAISEMNGELEYFKPYKEAYDTLFVEVGSLREKLNTLFEEERQKQSENELNERLTSLIYMYLIEGKSDIDGIVNYLIKNEGIHCDRAKASFLLNNLKQRINIEADSFRLRPQYQINPPQVLQDKMFFLDIPYGAQYYDILLVSDIHIKDFDAKTLNAFDEINNYCVNNNINLIMSLGDFFDGVGGSRHFEYSCAMDNYEIVEKAISLIPKADGIYHAVLGGNHDKNILKYGFDPIKMLSSEREDIINLGYTHSTVVFNGFHGIMGQFDLHHPQTFDFPIDFSDDGLDTEKLNLYLNSLYGNIGRDRKDSYIDVFGHTHKSQFNYHESYCFIPALIDGKSKRGACHLRVYFEENMDIKYMIFMPLSYNDKLVKNNEIIYKKVLTR